MTKTTTSSPELPKQRFASQAALAKWLAKNHASARGVWVEMAKKASGIASVTQPEAVEVALCWGWIDGQSKRIDDTWFVQKLTPRSKRSMWSKINRERVAQLIADGKMQPPGLAEIERAQADGRWDRAYDSAKSASVPEDLQAALAKNKKAAAFFAQLNAANRYAILHRVQTAKKPETRARRIATFVTMLARGEKLHP